MGGGGAAAASSPLPKLGGSGAAAAPQPRTPYTRLIPDDDGDDENGGGTDDHHHLIDEEMGKRGRVIAVRPWMLGLVVFWLLVLTVMVGIGGQAVPVPAQPAPALQYQYVIPFNLVPTGLVNGSGSGSRAGATSIMTLSLPTLEYDAVLHYNICCRQDSAFFCRGISVTKTIGVDGYLTAQKSAVIMIRHPDMVGARCQMMWG